jgi:hypothetical protein
MGSKMPKTATVIQAYCSMDTFSKMYSIIQWHCIS